MKELKAPDKVTQKMTHDGAVTENLATGEVTNISQREPEVDLSASSEEPASAAVDLAARAAEHHTHLSAKKQAKADDKAVKEGSAARRRPSSRLQFTDEERADPAMKKYIDRSDKAADKLDKAKAAIPTKKVIRKERTFDETTGKGKTRLRFEEVEKKPNGKLHHNPLSRPMQELRATAHSKIRQVEQDNVGVEAGHKGELLAERGVSYTGSKVRSAIRHHKTKPWRDAAKAEQASIKANAEYLYQKALHDDPALAASNPVSRYMQKQRIKRNYAKEVRKTGQNTKKAAQTAKSAAIRAKEAAKQAAAFVKSNWKVILIVVAIAAVVLLLIGGISSCTMMLGSGAGTVFSSSYLSEDTDIYAAENAYLSMEAELQYKLDNYELLNPGYDEYRYDLDDIEHDPYVLISILSALHEGTFTSEQITADLAMLFEKQYILTETVETETRYRTETRTGTRTVTDPETGETTIEEYEYEVQVPYTYYICNVKLENFNLSHVPVYIMGEETLSLYAAYMST
ncbi:MAG: peptidase M23, partial [Clostridia bacterium]|nr:peptidase M23 [Clostridia bacterium]